MFLLQALESFLGNIELWPATVISHLFIDEPNPTDIKRVSAFFYGNIVPYNIASNFYNICNEQSCDYTSNVLFYY